jgi:hypothetical protein
MNCNNSNVQNNLHLCTGEDTEQLVQARQKENTNPCSAPLFFSAGMSAFSINKDAANNKTEPAARLE